jgi:cystathionine gamma-synthase
MVSFEIEGDRPVTNALVQKLSSLSFAPTLGDINTTLSHPASSSHRGLSEARRAELGISEGFFRISVGIEPIETLIATFQAALGN